MTSLKQTLLCIAVAYPLWEAIFYSRIFRS